MREIPIETIELAIAVLVDFNHLDLSEVMLTEDGKPVEGITPELIERWKITGLSNKDFVGTRVWEDSEWMWKGRKR